MTEGNGVAGIRRPEPPGVDRTADAALLFSKQLISPKLLFYLYGTSERGEAISVAGVVVVGRTIRVDITEVIGVAGIRRPEPPVVDRTA